MFDRLNLTEILL